ncbi:MAG: Transcription elongation factor GreA [Fimbriimonadaceae bacterium]|nr:Transcription elongation factor GreA [Fimbriimonadaceae bacterium]
MESIESTTQSQILLTPEGYKTLQEELEHLTTVKRQEIADRLRDSREHGEFSEDNSELDEVKSEQAMVENRIADLRAIFAAAQVIDVNALSSDSVQIGTYVNVEGVDNSVTFEFRVVSSIEADPDRDLVSDESPLGTAVLGRNPGEVVQVEAPAGAIRYKIVSIRA